MLQISINIYKMQKFLSNLQSKLILENYLFCYIDPSTSSPRGAAGARVRLGGRTKIVT